MSLMSKNKMTHGLPKLVKPSGVCTECLLSNQSRGPFPRHTSFKSRQALELVHADLCGPISPVSTAGNKYFLLIVDDFTKVMWVYMLATKYEVLIAFKRFRVLVKKESEKKIKVLRTDRSVEFCSKQFSEYCEETGIGRNYTAPYTPQQNGVVERRNRTVVAMARSFLKEKGMPSNLWGEAIRHSVYVLNRLPTRSLSGTTPYKAWTGRKPDLSHLRIFGCLAHMKVPSAHVIKLDDRRKKVIYLGKELGTKACRLYDPTTGRIQVSSDVIFEEKKTWVWEEAERSSATKVQEKFTIVGDFSSGNS